MTTLRKQQCCICFNDEVITPRLCCSGRVCRQCLQSHIETQLVDVGNIEPRCPCSACDGIVPPAEIRELIASSKYTNLLERYDRWAASSNGAVLTQRSCPHCNHVTEVEPDFLVGTSFEPFGVRIQCSECQSYWCLRCQQPMHPGLACQAQRINVQRMNIADGDTLMRQWTSGLRASGSRNARRCPTCQVFIERNGGCNHMTCRQCATQFCYQCGQLYTPGHICIQQTGNFRTQDIQQTGNVITRICKCACVFCCCVLFVSPFLFCVIGLPILSVYDVGMPANNTQPSARKNI